MHTPGFNIYAEDFQPTVGSSPSGIPQIKFRIQGLIRPKVIR